jgi:hypothetical protein
MADITTTSQQNYPDFAMPYAAGFLNRAQQVTDQPYQAYQGGRVAGMAPWQDQAYQAQATRAMQGSPVMSGANTALQGFFGNQGQGAAQNQYGPVSAAQNQYGQVSAAENPYGYVSPQSNPYAGANPFITQQIDAAQGDLARNWNQVAAPQWAGSMQSSGSFGNSGVASAQALAMEGLQRNMGSIGQNMRFQDYTQQQQLGENAVNRALQAGQFNAGLGENFANRQMQAGQFNAGLGENYANRQMQAGQFNATMGENYAGRQDSMYGQGMNRQLSALGMAPQFAQQDYNDINQLQLAGQAYQNQNQRQMDAGYQQYLDARQYPQQQLGVFGQALGQAVGNQGTTTQTQPGASTGAQLLGGAITGSMLYNLLGLGG